MVYAAVTAFLRANGYLPSGILVTAVLKGGCNLNCPFCIVAKRDERREQSQVSAEHLTVFRAANERCKLFGGAAVVGGEPLPKDCRSSGYAPLLVAIYLGFLAILLVAPTILVRNLPYWGQTRLIWEIRGDILCEKDRLSCHLSTGGSFKIEQ